MKHANRGLSLVEVLIASVILALLFGAIFVLIFQGGTTFADANRHVVLQRNAREVLERIAQDLRYANPATLTASTPTAGEGLLIYQKSIGYHTEDKETIWGEMVTIGLEVSNVDANNNGIAGKTDAEIDDRRLTRTQNIDVNQNNVIDPEEQNIKSILCDYVKKYDAAETDPEKRGGFTVTMTPTNNNTMVRIDLAITLHVFDDDQKEMLTKVTTSVVLRRKV